MNKLNAINQRKIIRDNILKKKFDFNKILEFVDKIFIINLDERTDRIKKAIKELKSFNVQFDKIERFSGIVPKLVDIDKNIYKNFRVDLGKNVESYIIGATGCKLSHLEVIKIAQERGYENVLIFEDDFYMTDDFLMNLNDFIKKVKDLPRWDVLYLGGNNKSQEISNYCIPTKFDKVFRCKNVKCLHSYIVNRRLFPKVIEDLKTYGGEVDNYYMEILQPEYNAYIYNPILVKQEPSFSNIVNKDVNYFKK